MRASRSVMTLVAVLGVLVALAAVGGRSGVATAVAAEASGTTTPTADATPSAHTTRTIGYSIKGRPIVLETFGIGTRRILYLGGIHGNEYGGPVADRFAEYLRAHPSAVPSGTEIHIVATVNPDGRAARRRGNARNVDLNRNFPARNWNRKKNPSGTTPGASPGSEPETQAILALLETQRYRRIISLHSRGGIIDWDGPGGYTLSRRISRASRVRVHRLQAYHGSMGSYVPPKYRVPIITWELSSTRMTYRVLQGLISAIR